MNTKVSPFAEVISYIYQRLCSSDEAASDEDSASDEAAPV